MRIHFLIVALLLAGCNTITAPAPLAATAPPVDNRSCATIAKELQQVSTEVAQLEPAATAAAANNKEIRESYISKILIFQYIGYDAETVHKFDALKARKNQLELILTEKDCPALKL